MSRIDGLLTDNPEAIAFGRGRLSALRQAGHTNIIQTYETPFGIVTVRIVGGVETISVDTPGGYQTLPTSDEWPDGKDGGLPAYATLRIKGGGELKINDHVGHKAGVNTWRSRDGRTVVSYNTGQDAQHRHQYSVSERSVDGVPRLVVRGTEVETSAGVKGAAVCFGRTVYVAHEWDGGHIVPKAIVVYVYRDDEPDQEIGRFDLSAGPWAPRDVAFFGGSGRKFVMQLEPLAGGTPLRSMLTGVMAQGDDGELSVEFATTDEIPFVPTAGPGRQNIVWLELDASDELVVGVMSELSSGLGTPMLGAGLGATSKLLVNGDEIHRWESITFVFPRHINLRDLAFAWSEVTASVPSPGDYMVNGIARVRVAGFPPVDKPFITNGVLFGIGVPNLINIFWFNLMYEMNRGQAGLIDNQCVAVRRRGEMAVIFSAIPAVFFSNLPLDDEWNPDNWFDSGEVDLSPVVAFGKAGEVNLTEEFSEIEMHADPGFAPRSITIF